MGALVPLGPGSSESHLRGSLTLGASYLFDYYSDGSYSSITGGLHTMSVSLGYRFH